MSLFFFNLIYLSVLNTIGGVNLTIGYRNYPIIGQTQDTSHEAWFTVVDEALAARHVDSKIVKANSYRPRVEAHEQDS